MIRVALGKVLGFACLDGRVERMSRIVNGKSSSEHKGLHMEMSCLLKRVEKTLQKSLVRLRWVLARSAFQEVSPGVYSLQNPWLQPCLLRVEGIIVSSC